MSLTKDTQKTYGRSENMNRKNLVFSTMVILLLAQAFTATGSIAAQADTVKAIDATGADIPYIDGYIPENTNYPNFDLVELFVDEDRSGGNHLYDSQVTNAENAFSYHIMIYEPSDYNDTEYCFAA